jgi:hypothetical protein
MATKLRRFTKRLLIIINLVAVVFFLLACLAAYLDPQNWWFISTLALVFPFLLLVVLVFLIWWLFIKVKWAIISATALLLGIIAISHFYAFHIPASFKMEKEKNSIRVATWNVARFIEMKRNNNKGSQTRLK